MDDTRSDEERLPWLHAPRRTAASRRPQAKPRRGTAAPIFVLLSLFLLAGIGVIAFLVGRGSVSLGPVATSSQPVRPRATLAVPPTIPPAVAPAPAVAESAPPAAKFAAASPERVRTAPARKTAKARAPKPKKSASRITPRAQRAAAKIKADARRRAALRPSTEPRYTYIAQASPAKPGRVIQLGVYYDPRHADAAWRRVVGVYPYLGKLPKAVVPARGFANQPVYYRLQLGTRSRRDARILCRNLLSIGRGCRVV